MRQNCTVRPVGSAGGGQATAEVGVEGGEVVELLPAERQQLLFGGEQVPPGVEDLEIVGDAFTVADLREPRDLALGEGRALLGCDLLGEIGAAGERVGDFAEGLLDGALVGCDRDVLASRYVRPGADRCARSRLRRKGAW